MSSFKRRTNLACVAGALNLLYAVHKWFRRVRGMTATQSTLALGYIFLSFTIYYFSVTKLSEFGLFNGK